MFTTPILVIAYNRVAYTHDLFVSIKKIQPEKLYVSIDGAAAGDKVDLRNVLEVRSVFMPEWDCDLKLRYNDKHLGKSAHVVSAINWFFENEPEGIILFDDTLPHPDFFPYCAELLERFRDNKQIGHIGGCNILKRKYIEESYYYSAYPSVWGFATWKDRWEGFDLKLEDVAPDEIQQLFAPYNVKKKVPGFWLRKHKLLIKYSDIDIWEYQYFFHLWKKACYNIVPTVNLVENRGFSTKSKHRLRKLNRELKPIMPLVHNTTIVQHRKADQFMFRRCFKKDKLTFLRHWIDENILNS